ncbi:type VII secretion-associated serine protease mycosin [Nocardia sp. A7]|uniref:type VII secretion-associated serine protease mycosin n=1 Tax=Nocardia sp. A7 TaxID=2789274 RepID=UPI00397CD7D2
MAATQPARLRGVLAAVAVLGAWTLANPAPVSALAPPAIDDAALGTARAVNAGGGPPEPTVQRALCVEPSLIGQKPKDAPLPQQLLNLPAAWQFSRGAGQLVAVIDTGVNRHPRLDVRPGGDFVEAGGDGTVDCDGHGTLVAGLIAGRADPGDGFAGVAPDAQILAIRQLSLQFDAENDRGRAEPGKVAAGGYGNVLTMAAAVLRAVEQGATVINISEVSCSAPGAGAADGALGAAVKYAAEQNVVVIAAAGNLDQSVCAAQNELSGWDNVRLVVSPAWFSPYVLTVAATEADGSVSPFSIHGPWVGIAAPGRGIVSLDSRPGGTGLVDALRGARGMMSVDGTSFSAAYVSGLAALVRARFPELSAAQVIERIQRTAHNPGTGRDDRVGYGLIDPVAALTATLTTAGDDISVPRSVPAPAPEPGPDPLPRLVAIVGSGTLLAALAIGYGVSIMLRREDTESDDLADPAVPEGR